MKVVFFINSLFDDIALGGIYFSQADTPRGYASEETKHGK